MGTASDSKLRVLLLEDSNSDASLIKRELHTGFSQLQMVVATDRANYLHQIKNSWDIILADYNIPGMEELEFLKILQQSDIDTPVIIISGAIDDKTAIEAVKSGARDYLMKDNLLRLKPAILRELETWKIREREKLIRNRQTFLIKLAEILNGAVDITSAFEQIIDALQQYGGFEGAGIRFQAENAYPYRILKGYFLEFLNKAENPCLFGLDIKMPAEKDILFQKMLSGCEQADGYFTGNGSFYCPDLREYPASVNNTPDTLEDISLRLGFISLALIPIRVLGEIKGILHLAARKARFFDEDEIVFYEKLVNMIGIAFGREKMETELQQREEQMQKIIQHSDSVFTIMNIDNSVKFVSENVTGLLGYEIDDISRNWQKYMTDTPGNKEALKMLAKAMETGEYQGPCEVEFIHKNGKRIIVDTRQMPIVKDGKTVEIVGIMNDISYRRESEREIKEQDIHYRNLVEKARIGIAINDENGSIVFANEPFCGFFGYSHNDIIMSRFEDLIHPDDIDLLHEYQRHVLTKENGDSCELRGLHICGRIIYLELNFDILEDKAGNVKGMRIYLWDISRRKSQEEILLTMYNIAKAIRNTSNNQELFARIREHLSRILDTTNLFIALYDSEKDLLRIPLGIDSKDSLEEYPAGKTLSKYVINQGKAKLLHERDMDKLTVTGEIDLIGTPCKIWLGAPLRKEEEIIGVIVVQSYDNPELYTENDLQMLDFVSDEIASALQRKSIELELRQALNNLQHMHRELEKKVKVTVDELRLKDAQILQKRRQAAIGEMISRLAHNWRQPLNAISVTIHSIQDAWDFGELTDEILKEKISTSYNILKELSRSIDSFRHFYKSSEEERVFNIEEVINEVIELNRSRFQNNNVILSAELEGNFQIKGFRSEFSEVINNILTNSFDILLERKIAAPQVNVHQYCEKNHAVISIKDNGGGVSPEIQEIIFELYISTKNEMNSSGIGLYLSKMIIEKHLNGDLKLINHPDGAEFIIIL
ncbi:MAG: PAS domain S-box protein [Candidatus Cloacimonetes bacterium]|nr:PAS domain S-box protein [Candidatus Cloacimonadota bacterium]